MCVCVFQYKSCLIPDFGKLLLTSGKGEENPSANNLCRPQCTNQVDIRFGEFLGTAKMGTHLISLSVMMSR